MRMFSVGVTGLEPATACYKPGTLPTALRPKCCFKRFARYLFFVISKSRSKYQMSLLVVY